jgi:hypothetical protein
VHASTIGEFEMSRKERALCELYAEDPERADWLVFGRVAGPGRRGFLKGAGLATMSALLGASMPFHRARATDDRGVMQPFAIAWNPKGYLNNALHRIALTVAA